MALSRHIKVGIGSFSAMMFGIMFGWVAFPMILKGQLKKEMALSKTTDIREMWTKVPFALDFKVYLFNYTNADDVQKGAKPIVKEIGPYYFEEWKEKVNMEDLEDEDAILYNKKDTFYFIKSKSAPGLTGDEIIVLPHVFMLSLAIVVSVEKPAMLNLLGKAFNGIFDNPSDIFLRTRAMDLMFDGVIINCAQTDFAPKAVCTAIKKEATTLEFLPNNQYKFSLFGMRNATPDASRVKVLRGIKNIMDVGRVIAIDDEPEQKIWNGMPCNDYGGTDGTVFPPFLTKKDKLRSFAPDLCRTFMPWYEGKSSYKGIPTNRYVTTLGDPGNDPDLQCFCETSDSCPKKGLMDLLRCIKAPLIASLPHFLETDISVQSGVVGLNPKKEEHGIAIDFEPITGTPLLAQQRLQFNIQLKQIEKLQLCSTLPGVIAPLFWIEEGIALNDTFIGMMNSMLFRPKRIVGVVKWLLVSFGSLGSVAAALMHYKERIMQFAVKPENKNKPQPVEMRGKETKDISIIGQPTHAIG